MNLKAGSLGSDGQLTANSLSASIYDEINFQIPLADGEDPLARTKFALGVANGILKYLQANQSSNQSAFSVTVLKPAGTHPTETRLVSVGIEVP
jgi:hypothetical protein